MKVPNTYRRTAGGQIVVDNTKNGQPLEHIPTKQVLRALRNSLLPHVGDKQLEKVADRAEKALKAVA